MTNRLFLFLIFFSLAALPPLMAGGSNDVEHQTVDYVDLERFTGDWYVIALIPTSFEEDAALGIETYSLDEQGRIRVEYSFRKGGREGKAKTMTQKGWVINTETNAEWKVQPVWPLKLPYYVLELDEAYSYTAIATSGFDYLWIMSRTPEMEQELLSEITDRMAKRGFDLNDLVYMDQEDNTP